MGSRVWSTINSTTTTMTKIKGQPDNRTTRQQDNEIRGQEQERTKWPGSQKVKQPARNLTRRSQATAKTAHMHKGTKAQADSYYIAGNGRPKSS